MSFLYISTALITARFTSRRIASALGIDDNYRNKFVRKALNLAACYAGLVPKGSALNVSSRFGCCAALSAAYDLASDWCGFDCRIWSRLCEYASIELGVPDSALAVAHDLFRKDRDGCLTNHGLERGALTLLFIEKYTGSRFPLFPFLGCDHGFGLYLQVVDDLLDCHEDLALNHLNFLSAADGFTIIDEFLNVDVKTIRNSLDFGWILRWAVGRARRIAMRAKSTASNVGSKQPDKNVRVEDDGKVTCQGFTYLR